MLGSCFYFSFLNIPFLIKGVVCYSRYISIAIFTGQNLLDFILRAFFKAPEHLLFAVLKFEFNTAACKVVITYCFIKTGINLSIII